MQDGRGPLRLSGQAGSRGFTLIELLAALLILSIGLSSVFLVFGQALSVQSRNIHKLNAMEHARTLFAETQTRMNQGQISVPSSGKRYQGDLSGDYSYKLKLEPLEKYQDIYRTTVKVSWSSEGSRNSEAFTTLLRPQ